MRFSWHHPCLLVIWLIAIMMQTLICKNSGLHQKKTSHIWLKLNNIATGSHPAWISVVPRSSQLRPRTTDQNFLFLKIFLNAEFVLKEYFPFSTSILFPSFLQSFKYCAESQRIWQLFCLNTLFISSHNLFIKYNQKIRLCNEPKL